MTSPHVIGKIAAAERLIADRLDAWHLYDPHRRAQWLLAQLMNELGWAPPRDPLDDVPPLTGPGGSTPAAREAAREHLDRTIAANRARRTHA